MTKYTVACNSYTPSSYIRAEIPVKASTMAEACKQAKAMFCKKYRVKAEDVHTTALHRSVTLDFPLPEHSQGFIL